MRFFEHKWPALLLWPLSLFYGLVVGIRNLCYDLGIFKSFDAGCPVISIGNITAGGTGKTPMVQFVVEQLGLMGKRAAIISRGYKRSTKGGLLVSDGEKILCRVDQAGDEPFQLAKACTGTIVAVDENRVRAARQIVARFSPDVIVLDDAFQHRKIKRDIDIIMTRSGKAFGNGYLLPAGPLREPIAALRRAHLILSHNNEVAKNGFVLWGNIPVVMFDYEVCEILGKDGVIKMSELTGVHIFAFCGIAAPENFRSTLEKLGVNISGFLAFEDHHLYSADDVLMLRRRFDQMACKFIVTTEKDWVKLPIDEFDTSWLFIRIRLKLQVEKIVSRIENIL